MFGYSADDGSEATADNVETMGDPDDKFQVVLLRGPDLPARIFYESKKKKARHKAEALAEAHDTHPILSEDGRTYTINAHDYYSDLGKGRFEEEKPGAEERELLEFDEPDETPVLEFDESFED